MLTILTDWLTQEGRRWRERRLVAELLRLNDHQLADIGLRRDQLQPDGIRALDLPPRSKPLSQRRTARHGPVIRPSLQGCG